MTFPRKGLGVVKLNNAVGQNGEEVNWYQIIIMYAFFYCTHNLRAAKLLLVA